MFAGLIGVPLGSYLATRLRCINQKCDPLICAWGLFVSGPLIYFALVLAKYSSGWCYMFVFIAQVSLNLCWSIVADIALVRIVIKLTKRTIIGFYRKKEKWMTEIFWVFFFYGLCW